MTSRTGLTLIELLVYLAVLTLVTALAVPAFTGSYRHLSEESLIQNLERDIRFAQYRAIMEGNAYALQYNDRENIYRFLREERRADRPVPEDQAAIRRLTNRRSGRHVEWRPVEERWGKPRKIGNGIRLSFRGRDKIYFIPDGEITEGSIAVIAGSETIATLFPGHSLLGVEIKRKGDLPHAA